MEKKKRLLFVGAFPPLGVKIYGGAVTACATLKGAGLAEHFDLILLNSTQRTVPPPPVWLRFLYSLPRCWKYMWHVIRNRPDAILIFSSSGFSFLEKSLFAMFGHFFCRRVLLFPRGGRLMNDCRRGSLYRFFVKFMLRFPDILLCQGEAWRNFFTREIGELPEKCVVLTNWSASPALIKIGATRTYHPMTNKKLQILFLGWVYRTKGIFELLEAFSLLHSRFSNLELLIAGEGEASHSAREYLCSKGLGASVSFLGWIDGDQKLQTLADADVFCLPSYVEGLPNAMIEAMATGLPIVVTPVGSIPDFITHEVNGMISPIGDSQSLANCLEALITSDSLRARIGRNAYVTASREFNAEKAVLHLSRLIT